MFTDVPESHIPVETEEGVWCDFINSAVAVKLWTSYILLYTLLLVLDVLLILFIFRVNKVGSVNTCSPVLLLTRHSKTASLQ